jgi:hypothetical protein
MKKEEISYVGVFDKPRTEVRGTLHASKSPNERQGLFDLISLLMQIKKEIGILEEAQKKQDAELLASAKREILAIQKKIEKEL